ncbi:hypothetical protein MRX96_010409 [Rhipicephalus microplus]
MRRARRRLKIQSSGVLRKTDPSVTEREAAGSAPAFFLGGSAGRHCGEPPRWLPGPAVCCSVGRPAFIFKRFLAARPQVEDGRGGRNDAAVPRRAAALPSAARNTS